MGTLSGESAPHLRGLWAVVANHGLDCLAEGVTLVLQKVGLWEEQEFGGISEALCKPSVI